ncbi:hypothetical protein [Streptomyces albospinus]|uniref:hypothetical protein n=1 Tax=Streptomyces albospinus TaxID=285515 RepID=UPI00166FB0C0|nr:hypothetical protein [Streptomyces albospinus]
MAQGTGLRNWYVDFECPKTRRRREFDASELTVNLVIGPCLDRFQWKGENEEENEDVRGRRLGIIADAEHQAVELVRAQVLALLADRAGPLADADRWAAWRWNPVWPSPRVPGAQRRTEAAGRAVPAYGAGPAADGSGRLVCVAEGRHGCVPGEPSPSSPRIPRVCS